MQIGKNLAGILLQFYQIDGCQNNPKGRIKMKLKKFKQRLSQALVATMLVTSTGVSSLAATQTWGGALAGKEDTDYRLVTLHLDKGEFGNPLKYVKVASTPSDATPGDATSSNAAADDFGFDIPLEYDLALDADGGELVAKEADEDFKSTTFAVDRENDFLVNSNNVRDALSGAELFYTEEERPYDGSEIVWMTEPVKDGEAVDLDQAVDLENGLNLTQLETDLYAVTFKGAKGDMSASTNASAMNLPENTDLRVRTLPEKYKAFNNELLTQLSSQAGYVNADVENSIWFDMHLLRDGEEVSADGKTVTVQMDPSNVDGKGDPGVWKDPAKTIKVLHFADEDPTKAPEDIKVERLKDKWGQYTGMIRFEVSSFSPFVIFTMDKMVKVKLNSAVGGIGIVSSYGYDYDPEADEMKNEKYTFLPVDQEVEIPAGVTLQLRYDNYSTNEYFYDLSRYQIIEDGVENTDENNQYGYTVSAEVDSVELTPVFEKKENEERDWWFRLKKTEVLNGKNSLDGKVSLRIMQDGQRVDVNAENWKLTKPENSYIKLDNELVELSADGTIRSKDVLPLGHYQFYVSCEYNGETYEGYIGTDAGVDMMFLFYAGKFDDPELVTPADYWLGESEYYEQGTLFNKIYEDTKAAGKIPEIAMYGGYTFAGWYHDNDEEMAGKKWADEEAVNGFANAYARFQDAEGNLYDPLIKLSDSSTNPEEPENPSRPGSSGGGGGGGGSSRSSANADTMSGTWQQDERGWRFQLVGGGYATNTWGRIHGNWYYFGADTYMMTGWIYVGEQWYYLSQEQGNNAGKMQTGWFFDTSYNQWFYLNASGAMQTGWQQINNVWYYLNPISDGTRGAMLSEQWVDEYYVDANGAWVPSMTR